jgi:hypothetical protein
MTCEVRNNLNLRERKVSFTVVLFTDIRQGLNKKCKKLGKIQNLRVQNQSFTMYVLSADLDRRDRIAKYLIISAYKISSSPS